MSERAPEALASARDRIDEFLRECNLAEDGTQVVALTKDASDRSYFRVLSPSRPSIVLALHATAIEFESLPFAHVARLLAAMPVPVPAIIGHSDALGIVAQQDLGDVTLQAHLGASPPNEHAALYRQAVSLIEQLQRRGEALASRGDKPFSLAFDVEKLTWELHYFVRHFLEAYRGASIRDETRRALDEEWQQIAGELAAEPRVLCHRDYHSRNLMVHGGQLYLIDFQDARLGPDTYDLASLLRDSYVDIADADRDQLIAYFLALKQQSDADQFRRRFDLMSLQRNLKALGTFGHQAATRNNPIYIQYIPRTLRYVRLNLQRYPRFGRLRELLSEYLEELR
jgi:hypothetical protein